VICVETRHMRAVLQAQINKTDRNDARGMAQMMRAGLWRSGHRREQHSGLRSEIEPATQSQVRTPTNGHVFPFTTRLLAPELHNRTAQMPDDLLNCDIPAELIRFDLPLINLATQLIARGLLR